MDDFQTDDMTPTRPLNRDAEPMLNRATHTYQLADDTPLPVLRPAAPSAARIYEMIMGAAERQIETALVARSIIEVVAKRTLLELMAQIAANAANPIADLLEDALADALRPVRDDLPDDAADQRDDHQRDQRPDREPRR